MLSKLNDTFAKVFTCIDTINDSQVNILEYIDRYIIQVSCIVIFCICNMHMSVMHNIPLIYGCTGKYPDLACHVMQILKPINAWSWRDPIRLFDAQRMNHGETLDA